MKEIPDLSTIGLMLVLGGSGDEDEERTWESRLAEEKIWCQCLRDEAMEKVCIVLDFGRIENCCGLMAKRTKNVQSVFPEAIVAGTGLTSPDSIMQFGLEGGRIYSTFEQHFGGLRGCIPMPIISKPSREHTIGAYKIYPHCNLNMAEAAKYWKRDFGGSYVASYDGSEQFESFWESGSLQLLLDAGAAGVEIRMRDVLEYVSCLKHHTGDPLPMAMEIIKKIYVALRAE